MTFDPQALYDAVRPFVDELERQLNELRKQRVSYRIEEDLIYATKEMCIYATDMAFTLHRFRRERPTLERRCDCGGVAVICQTCMTERMSDSAETH